MNNKTELYFVHIFNDFSGSPRVLRDVIDSEIIDPDNIYVLTSRHSGFLDGVCGHRLSCFYARSNNRYIQLFYYLLSQLLIFFQLSFYLLRSTIRKRESTIIVNTMLPFGAVLSGKLFGKKVVSYVHETKIKPKLLKQFLRLFIEHCADNVIFVSKYLQSVEAFKRPKQNVIYNGLRSDFPEIEEVDISLKFEGKMIFFAGSLREYKGISQLIEIANRLPEFKVVAALNCSLDELHHFTANRELPSNFLPLARPQDIQDYFRKSFIVLNLSLPDGWVETFGLSLIEGMAFGTPVVAPPVGGPTEFVDSSNGLLVDSRCIDDIVCFVQKLNSSINIWSSFSHHAFYTSKQFRSSVFIRTFRLYFQEEGLA